MIQYSSIVTGPLGENCYLLWNTSQQAWIIDPGADDEEICAELEARQLMPSCIVLTHGHFDHLGALDALLKKWPNLPVVMRQEETTWAFTNAFNQYPPFYMLQQPPATLQAAEETLTIGDITATLIPTPGHTPGGQCILIDQGIEKPLCFTGDTLFQGSIGRTDLPGGSFSQLSASLKVLKARLTPETTILSGHGPASTMAHEVRFNPYLQEEMDTIL